MSTPIFLPITDGTTETIESADVSSVAAMTASQALAAGVSAGIRVTVAGTVYESPWSVQDFLTAYRVALALASLNTSGPLADFSTASAVYVDVTGTGRTAASDGAYLVNVGGIVSIDDGAEQPTLALLVDGVVVAEYAPIMNANAAPQASLAALSGTYDVVEGNVVIVQAKVSGGATVTIKSPSITIMRAGS